MKNSTATIFEFSAIRKWKHNSGRFLRVTAIVLLVLWRLSQHKSFAEDLSLHLPDPAYRYADLNLPSHFQTSLARSLDNQPPENPVTDAGATLGRVLFYDVRLSANNAVSCGSCHVQEAGFADPRPASIGFSGKALDRNAMSLVELRYAEKSLFWDGRTATLEELVLIPIENTEEMGHSLPEVVKTIAADPRYVPLFKEAFGEETVTSRRISQALAQFLRSMISYQSKYDVGLEATKNVEQDFPNFSAAENHGKALFLSQCSTCHRSGQHGQNAFFGMIRPMNNGLDRSSDLADGGRADISFNTKDTGLFKASSLRNIEYTAPYMHDGRLQTLEEVIEHYSSGVQNHPNVHNALFRMNLTSEEKQALIAFLKCLSDEQFLHDPRFSNPWRGGSTNFEKAPVAISQKPILDQQSLSAEERSNRLANGEGLPPGETLLWLMDLDQDGDGSLNAEEYQPLIDIWKVVGLPPARSLPGAAKYGTENTEAERTSPRGPESERVARIRRPVDPMDQSESSSAGAESERKVGANVFTTMTAREAAEKLARFRDERFLSQMKRSIRRLGLSDADMDLLDNYWQEELPAHRHRVAEMDQQLIAQVERLLGSSFAVFQNGILKLNIDSFPQSPSPEQVNTVLAKFDLNADHQLNRDEIKVLARSLDSTPGGFARTRPEQLNIHDFAQHLLKYDTDQTGTIDRSELPDRLFPILAADTNGDGEIVIQETEQFLRERAFQSVVQKGIYTDDGLGNAILLVRPLIAELDLPEGLLGELTKLLDEYDAAVQKQNTEIATRLLKILEPYVQPVAEAGTRRIKAQ